MLTIKTINDLDYLKDLKNNLFNINNLNEIEKILIKYGFTKITKNHFNNKVNSIFITKSSLYGYKYRIC